MSAAPSVSVPLPAVRVVAEPMEALWVWAPVKLSRRELSLVSLLRQEQPDEVQVLPAPEESPQVLVAYE